MIENEVKRSIYFFAFVFYRDFDKLLKIFTEAIVIIILSRFMKKYATI